jgi:membrane-bound lytic murein transglycosylase D
MNRAFFFLLALSVWLGMSACSHVSPPVSKQPLELTEAFDEERDVPETAAETEEVSEQRLIDEALEYYQQSQVQWEQGLIEETMAALDQSYASILRIPPDRDPNILQQKEDLRLLISKRIQEIYASRLSGSQVGNNGAIPLVLNTYVEREIKLFQTVERKFFVDSYRRAGRYRDYIEEELRKAGLPVELVWLPLIESGYKDKAFSRSRALGIWQFISSTGVRFNLKRDQWIDERMDFQKATRAAIDYLTALHDLFGDWTTALAAYNCGEGNVMRAIRQQRVNYLDNFWDLYPMLPSETARYVPRLLATLHIINAPEQYGFSELQQDSAVSFDEVCTQKQMKLADIAGALNVSRGALEALNPALRQKVTPNYSYTLRVPADTGDLLTAKLDEIPQCKVMVQSHTRHRVRRGETLSQIARKYRTSVRKIARLNGIRNVSRIRVGQKLKVPLRYPLTKLSSVTKGSSSSTAYTRYRVRRGDTLWSIARKYNTSVKTIKNLNGLSSNFLHAGQVLHLPAGT